MQHRSCMRRPKLGTWLAFFAIALGLSSFALPAAWAARQGPEASPNQPALVSPAVGATGVTIPPTLNVTAADPESNPTTVPSRGQAEASAAPDFTLVVIPDPQNCATACPDVYAGQTQWIVDSRAASNIVFATCVGDLVNLPWFTTEYDGADAAFDILDAGNVPYSVGPGNHDMYVGTLWPSYFGVSRFSGKSWFGGSYDNYNTYSLFSASGMDFILINLQYSPSTAILNWADGLLATYSNRRAIVEQHDLLDVDNTWVNQASYNALRDNANLFLMLCGHNYASNDGAAYVAGTGTDGHTIHVVMADYQNVAASGYLRLLRFSPANDMIYMTTYSPITGGSITTDPDQKNLVYVMPDGPATVPKAPVVTSISLDPANVSNVVLAWDEVAQDMNNNATTIIKYQVYGSSLNPYFTSGGTLLGETTTTTFTHNGIATGTTNWYYLVRAVNVVGESDFSVRRTGRFGFTLVPGS